MLLLAGPAGLGWEERGVGRGRKKGGRVDGGETGGRGDGGNGGGGGVDARGRHPGSQLNGTPETEPIHVHCIVRTRTHILQYGT